VVRPFLLGAAGCRKSDRNSQHQRSHHGVAGDSAFKASMIARWEGVGHTVSEEAPARRLIAKTGTCFHAGTPFPRRSTVPHGLTLPLRVGRSRTTTPSYGIGFPRPRGAPGQTLSRPLHTRVVRHDTLPDPVRDVSPRWLRFLTA
jgi:hypothetical protein